MSLKTSLKSFNRYRMQLPDWSHPWSHYSHPPPSLLATCFWTNEIQDSKLTFKALHQQSPTHIQDLITRYLPSRSLRSSSMLSLNPVSFNLKNYRSRAFSVSAPELWNKLPDNIRSCENLSLLKHKLKTHLFKKFYLSHWENVFDFMCVLFKFTFILINF